MADAQKKNDEVTLNQRISDFIQKNRKYLFFGLITIFVILAGFVIVNTARERSQSKALSKVYDFNRRYQDLKSSINGDDPDALAKQLDLLVLLKEINTFESKNSGFAAARAYGISASILADQKRWAEAEEAWSNAAKKAGKTYLAPVFLFNAAVAAEEQGNIDSAIEHYTKTLDFGNVFPSAARAQFSVGRLEESRNNSDAAILAYRNLLSKWPSDPVWPNLAQSRILVLSN